MKEESLKPGPVQDLAKSQLMRDPLYKIMGPTKVKQVANLGTELKASVIGV